MRITFYEFVCPYCCPSHPACKSHIFCIISHCHLRPVWLYHVSPHYLINDMILGKNLMNIKCAFPGRTPCCPAPDPRQPAAKVCTVIHIHLSNILSTHTTTSNPLTLTPLTSHTIDTLYPLLSLGTHTDRQTHTHTHTHTHACSIVPTKKQKTYITLLNSNYIFSPLQCCTPQAANTHTYSRELLMMGIEVPKTC